MEMENLQALKVAELENMQVSQVEPCPNCPFTGKIRWASNGIYQWDEAKGGHEGLAKAGYTV